MPRRIDAPTLTAEGHPAWLPALKPLRPVVRTARLRSLEWVRAGWERDHFLTVPTALSAVEGGNAVIVVTSAVAFLTNTAIGFQIVPLGGAVAGVDYTPVSSPLILLAGQTTATLSIPILNDGITDPNESLRVDWLSVTAL